MVRGRKDVLTNPLRNYAKESFPLHVLSGLFKKTVYDPKRRRLFPSSPYWDVQRISQIQNPEQQRKAEIDLALNMAMAFSGGTKDVGRFSGLSTLAEQGINPVYHETSPNLAIEKAISFGGEPQNLRGIWVSPKKHLALGQGKNIGALMRLDTKGLYGSKRVSQIGPRAYAAVTGKIPEFQINKATGNINDIIESIILSKNPQLSRLNYRRMKNLLTPVEELPNSLIRYVLKPIGVK